MKKVLIGLVAIIFVILCFIFNRYDLDISIQLTKYHNWFFELFDDYGELPIYVGPVLFGATFRYLSKKTLHKLVCEGITFGALLIATIKVIDNKDIELNIETLSLALSIAIILTILILYCFSKIKIESLDKIKDIAILGLVVTIVSVCCTQALKTLWGRVRFRDLSADYSEFTRLFKINGPNGNHSFPSGHTNAGTSILLISLLVPRLTDKKWIKYLVTTLCFIYILTLAISRIIASAHYASDVLAGFTIGFTTLCVSYYILKRKGVINVASNKC